MPKTGLLSDEADVILADNETNMKPRERVPELQELENPVNFPDFHKYMTMSAVKIRDESSDRSRDMPMTACPYSYLILIGCPGGFSQIAS